MKPDFCTSPNGYHSTALRAWNTIQRHTLWYDFLHIKKTVFMGDFKGIVVIVGKVMLGDVISIDVTGVIIVGKTLDGGSGAAHVMPA